MWTSDMVCSFFQNDAIQFKLCLQIYNKTKVDQEFLCHCGVSDKRCSVLKNLPFCSFLFLFVTRTSIPLTLLTIEWKVWPHVQKVDGSLLFGPLQVFVFISVIKSLFWTISFTITILWNGRELFQKMYNHCVTLYLSEISNTKSHSACFFFCMSLQQLSILRPFGESWAKAVCRRQHIPYFSFWA